MTLARCWKSTAATLGTLCIAAAAWAQDPTSGGTSAGTNTTTTTTTVWYGQWYVWVGIALFVIIVIALTNRGSRQS